MFKRVILRYDGSDAAGKALKWGAEHAMLMKSEVLVLSVSQPAAATAARKSNCREEPGAAATPA